MYPIEKYQIYKHTTKDGIKEIIAVSTYAGKCVRGVAKCDPRDEYNEDIGVQLAVARCNARIAEKRRKRAAKLLKEADIKVAEAQRYVHKMMSYSNDATIQAEIANKKLIELEAQFDK